MHAASFVFNCKAGVNDLIVLLARLSGTAESVLRFMAKDNPETHTTVRVS